MGMKKKRNCHSRAGGNPGRKKWNKDNVEIAAINLSRKSAIRNIVLRIVTQWSTRPEI
jgi:hypothetical protein